MKPVIKLAVLYGTVLFSIFLFIWWVQFASPFDIPKYIPSTPISINGLLIICSIIGVLIFALKKTLKRTPSITLLNLFAVGVLIVVIAEFTFQTILITLLSDYTVEELLRGTLIMGILGGVLSFLISFQLKTKRTRTLWLFIIAICLVARALEYFHVFTNGN